MRRRQESRRIVTLMVDDHYIMHRTISIFLFRTFCTFIIFLKIQTKTICNIQISM